MSPRFLIIDMVLQLEQLCLAPLSSIMHLEAYLHRVSLVQIGLIWLRIFLSCVINVFIIFVDLLEKGIQNISFNHGLLLMIGDPLVLSLEAIGCFLSSLAP